MANYTIELRHLLAAGYVPSLSDYPIFSEPHRATLNAKILKHYAFSEIGLETPDRFDWYLSMRMSEIMPYYNQLYASELLTFDPLSNSKSTESASRENSGVVNGTNTSNANGNTNLARGKTKAVQAVSDTPQSNLSMFDIESGGYASNVTVSESTPEADITTDHNEAVMTNSGESASVEASLRTVTGYTGVIPSDMLIQYRKSFMNIDQMIILELADLFMGVYS